MNDWVLIIDAPRGSNLGGVHRGDRETLRRLADRMWSLYPFIRSMALVPASDLVQLTKS